MDEKLLLKKYTNLIDKGYRLLPFDKVKHLEALKEKILAEYSVDIKSICSGVPADENGKDVEPFFIRKYTELFGKLNFRDFQRDSQKSVYSCVFDFAQIQFVEVAGKLNCSVTVYWDV